MLVDRYRLTEVGNRIGVAVKMKKTSFRLGQNSNKRPSCDIDSVI